MVRIDETDKSEQNLPVDSVEQSLRLIDDLKFFLATAPANWQENQVIRRYYLNNKEGFISCVYWKNIYYITGTDIVRGISYKFRHFGRVITDQKKFEEGIFSDLRMLKCGTDAVLENPKSPFLVFLLKNQCLKTQKKQKVFFWFSVPHDKLFCDALERDLKKEMEGKTNTTTKLCQEPAISFKYSTTKPILELLNAHLESKTQELGLNTLLPVESPITSEYEPDTDNHYETTTKVQLPVSQMSSSPLFVQDENTAAEGSETVPKEEEDPLFLRETTDDEDSNYGAEFIEDFPLEDFQLADAYAEQQEYLDPYVFLNIDPVYHQPMLMDDAPLNSASYNYTHQRNYLYPDQQQPQFAQQQQQLTLYPTYGDYPEDDYISQMDPYGHYLPYVQYVPLQPQYFMATSPLFIPYDSYNMFNDQLQPQYLLGLPTVEAAMPKSAGLGNRYKMGYSLKSSARPMSAKVNKMFKRGKKSRAMINRDQQRKEAALNDELSKKKYSSPIHKENFEVN